MVLKPSVGKFAITKTHRLPRRLPAAAARFFNSKDKVKKCWSKTQRATTISSWLVCSAHVETYSHPGWSALL
jgi:hypothetical protein